MACARQTSHLTKVFRLTNEQARHLYEHDLTGARPEFFRQPVDSFLTDSARRYQWRPLPPGYYLVARTEGPQLLYWLRSETNRQLTVLDNQVDLTLLVRDSTGRPLAGDARVMLGRRVVPFDAATRTFRLPKAGHAGLVAVTYRGLTTYHALSQTLPPQRPRWTQRGAPSLVLRLGRRLLYGFPLGYLTRPVRNLVGQLRHASYVSKGLIGLLRSPFSEDVRDERQDRREERRERRSGQAPAEPGRIAWASYVAFNKPRYRPSGDTLRLKIRLLRRPYGRPARQRVVLWLGSENGKPKRLTELRPVRPGSYEYTLPLTDTLGLQPDSYVQVSLTTLRGTTLASGQFRLEDYELSNTEYALRVAEKEHRRGQPQSFFLRGTDANGLNLLDARVRLSVVPDGMPEWFAQRQLFVPDTLWRHAGPLDTSGETRLDLPADRLPAANFRYRVLATFLNTDNERHEENTVVPFRLDPGQLTAELVGDSVRLRYLHLGQSRPAAARLCIAGASHLSGDTLFSGPVRLPLTLPVDARARRYDLRDSAGHVAQVELTTQNAGLALQSERTRDSVYLAVDNPRRLRFWCFVYRGNRLVYRRYAEPDWRLVLPARSAAPWYISVHYLWGEQLLSQEYNVPLERHQLRIQSDLPAVAYPGQQLQLNFTVTDVAGRPVPGADLTAFAYTNKFDEDAEPNGPGVPDLEPPLYGRASLRRFRLRETSFENRPDATRQQLLRWAEWRRTLRLDSLRFYHFLYPEAGQFYEYRPAPGGLTQVAPFVVDSGRVQPPVAVYLDGVPVYVHDVNHAEPYSLVAEPGLHTLSIRTTDRLVTLHDVYLRHLHKLTLSVDVNRPCQELTVQRLGPLRPEEHLALSRSLVMLDESYDHLRDATLRQGNRLQPVVGNVGGRRVAGPFRPDSLLLRRPDGYRRKFAFEPLFSYSFGPALLRMRCVEPVAFGPLTGAGFGPALPLDGFAYTEAAVRELQRRDAPAARLPYDYNANQYPILENPNRTEQGQGQLVVREPLSPAVGSSWPAARYLLVTRPDQPKFQRLLFSLNTVHALAPGRYRVAVLLADSSCWAPAELVDVRPNGTTYLQLRATDRQQLGQLSRRIGRLVRQRIPHVSALSEDRLQRREIKVHAPVLPGVQGRLVRGRVFDRSTEEGLPGVTVLVRGTTVGISTNTDGTYELDVPLDARTLLFSSIGYVTQEKPVGDVVDVGLSADNRQLSEVVVTGMGLQMERRELTGSVSSVLAGRAAGVSITGAPSSSVRIRGTRSVAADSRPLIILDGLPLSGRLEDLNPATIASIKELPAAQATGLYGVRGANGVLIVTSKAGLANSSDNPGRDPRLQLRRRFSDYGWWRPTLVTDARGRASTTVTLPDDVTGWRAFVLGSDAHGRTGRSSGELRAFKALLAELAVPRFLVAGDRAQVIGKTLNYLPDTAQVSTTFRVGEAVVRQQAHRVSTSALDTLTVTAPATPGDSLQLTFGLAQNSGYQDGEQRRIPIVPAGSRETVGAFLALTAADTTLTLPSADPAKGDVTVRVDSDPLPAILSEIQHLQQYAYLCNEQAASKLKALLLERRIRQYEEEDFKGDRSVNYLIRKLLAGRRQPEGLWGTWPSSAVSYWATAHVLEALLDAEHSGYRVTYDRAKVAAYLLKALDEGLARTEESAKTQHYLWYHYQLNDHLRLLRLLLQLQATADYRTYLTRLARLERGRQPLDRYLAFTELRQQLQLPYQLDTLRRYRLRTALGGVFYADTLRGGSYYRDLLAGDVGSTLLAYRVLRAHGGQEAELTRMRVYLLGLRRTGYWRSTYEAAQILETIGPDLFAAGRAATFARVEFSGGLQQRVTQFPFETKLPATSGSISLRKEGPVPVYATAYQTFWNPAPVAKTGTFAVSTSLAGQKGRRVQLRAGQPAELLVTVDVKEAARYVLVEVPIPAGCSYGPPAATNFREVHREYLRHQTGIFLDELPVGRHTFRINLQPRFRGRYTLNPATAELVYFPTKFGRTDSKQAEVR
ncbi:hypothetical protein B0919_08825 [Hymenobacter sp. CRA2]|nr:hypothetical protein B0919_08825 [Hymenobacter sp. CRA2]